MDLAAIWAFIIAFAIAAYVVMDGFDLGIGILFPFLAEGKARDCAMNSIAPVWDGNETWLVLGGGGLLAAFPLAYSIILPALYAPLIAMLIGLIFRGVAFEFRWSDTHRRRWWDAGFSAGSLVAALMQGMTLGALVQGITVRNGSYAGGWWEWLSPFSILTGAGLVVGYAMLGACWLIWKTDGELQAKARLFARITAPTLLGIIGAISLATPFVQGQYWDRWFDSPWLLVAISTPLLILAAAIALRASRHGRDWLPFILALSVFLATMVGLGFSIWPNIVPGRVSIWEAAAPHSSQLFLLVGAAVLIPTILAYSGFSYWVFRGKVGEESFH